MQNIALPKKISFKDSADANQKTVVIEPLFPGYGMTLGNSLRRVLLSSLPGAAVVGVKIKGASHEFMTLPNIKEDVLEIVLNLKQLRFKFFSGEEVRLELKKKGKGLVKASDITKNSQVEIKNSDLVIANISDEAGSLEVEIIAREGRGYRIPEGVKKENRELGYIEIDSIFSPVIMVSSSVENTRVGKMTNWDKLSLDIKTDGTITPEEAFERSVGILINQYSALRSLPEEEEAEKKEEKEEKEEKKENKKEKKVEEKKEKAEKKETKKAKK